MDDIVSGREKSEIVLIEDNIAQSGGPVLKSFLKSLSERVDKIHYFVFDPYPQKTLENIPSGCLNRIEIHDGFRDIGGWLDSSSISVNTDLVKYFDNLSGRHAKQVVAIVINSVSPLLLHRTVPYTCQTISRLARQIDTADVEQIVCLVHQDLHDNHEVAQLEHMCSTIIRIEPSAHPQFNFCTGILHKRVSGKIVRRLEHFNIRENYEVYDVTEVKMSCSKSSIKEESSIDPTANLTFNLSLTDEEKAARSQVKLPYMHDENRQDATLSKSVGEGKIFYQPDEADDFDDDDPDDDLDI
ncbi:hypothetical protein CHS0354_022870 [Potamilus streckersoni]|uniref:Elongator complex protein 5 n=1 Tax=Potamilus streckersoni TaxID=2493646 RepID=A0AAE0S205_9BIVA|nr:hypothetical protein CHS0354_022870 [Potamilus streckersoni]